MNKNRWNLDKQFLIRAVLPVIGLGILLTASGYYSFRAALLNQTKQQLRDIGEATNLYFEYTYPGDYSLVSGQTPSGDTTYDLYKGETCITTEYNFLDDLQEKTGIDVAIFYADTQILTTIFDNEKRLVGYGANTKIVEEVLNAGQEKFYNNALNGTISYFAYYAPIRNTNETIVGMIFVGKPSRDLAHTLSVALLPIILVALLCCIAIGGISVYSSKKMVSAIKKVDRFFKVVADGNLNATLHQEIATRPDELGDMARTAQSMQKSLKDLIERDGLTGLYNRRYSEKRLSGLYEKSLETGSHFTAGIMDIDFFKRVNDTYGHEAGDVVLRGVSHIIEQHMAGKGYVGRWGGEEFLVVFEHLGIEDAVRTIEEVLDEIRATVFSYHEDEIRVTMTCGLTEEDENQSMNEILKEADDRLYFGKQNGRNQIVSTHREVEN